MQEGIYIKNQHYAKIESIARENECFKSSTVIITLPQSENFQFENH